MFHMYLRDLYQQLDKAGRDELAAKVGIKPAYLWQIATGWDNKKPSLDLLSKLAEAHARLSVAELVQEFTEGREAKPVADVGGKRSATNHPGERSTDKKGGK
jgi:transcriptional regulator with XRE-family HTH domain